MLAIEIGYKQGDDVLDLMLQYGYSRVEILDDLTGRPRIARGYWLND
jgi:methylase of polypeptide subunit release factors